VRHLFKNLAPRDLWLVLSACTTGIALVFALFAPVGWAAKVSVLGSGLVLALAYHFAWWWLKKIQKVAIVKDVVVLKETVLIDVGGSAEIVFAPTAPVESPRLVMSAHGRPVKVEDVWHAGLSTISVPRSILYWCQGVTCTGCVSVAEPLKILLRNAGHAPVSVRASLVVTPKE
jgi:hypothetical protein